MGVLKGIRILVITIGVFVLFMTPSSSVGFFTSLLIFSSGLAEDYWNLYYTGVVNRENNQKRIAKIGGVLSGIYVLISFLGLISILTVSKSLVDSQYIVSVGENMMFQSFSFSIWWILAPLGLFILGAIIEAFFPFERIPISNREKG